MKTHQVSIALSDEQVEKALLEYYKEAQKSIALIASVEALQKMTLKVSFKEIGPYVDHEQELKKYDFASKILAECEEETLKIYAAGLSRIRAHFLSMAIEKVGVDRIVTYSKGNTECLKGTVGDLPY